MVANQDGNVEGGQAEGYETQLKPQQDFDKATVDKPCRLCGDTNGSCLVSADGGAFMCASPDFVGLNSDEIRAKVAGTPYQYWACYVITGLPVFSIKAPAPRTRVDLKIHDENEDHLIRRVAYALAAVEAGLYVRDGRLQRERIADDGRPALVELTNSQARGLISGSIRFLRPKGGDPNAFDGRRWVEVPTPKYAGEALIELGEYDGIPIVKGVVGHPVVRPDGSVVAAPGYHRESGLYLTEGLTLTVPDNPTPEDVRDAVKKLFDLVGDFEFNDETDKAAWLALLLTKVARRAVDGPTPIFAVTANTRGAGKSLLCRVVDLIVTGKEPCLTPYNSKAEESAKVILANAVEGDQTVLFDNLDTELGDAALDGVVTSMRWKGRRLGKTETIEVDVGGLVWVVNGNNVSVKGDTRRRVLPIRLTSTVENPENRANFKIDDLVGYVKSNRAELLAAVCTILRAYVQAGKPVAPVIHWGTYEAWSGLVRQAVIFAGLPDPYETRQYFDDARDPELDAVRYIVENWERFTEANLAAKSPIKRLIERVRPRDYYGKEQDAADDFGKQAVEVIRLLTPWFKPHELSRKLTLYIDRKFGNRRLVRAGVIGGTAHFRVIADLIEE